ncbi:AraC family transcriptional regulator [Neptunicella marina]|uniref:AraC family transcriptional regulator n=1 Tax=Neptunicella marina TaxID=2125989 RepID=A0A8J6IXR5_9ALTE|nr:AraC family transcriptional regulator [Neptunicella marina]MBC3767193.1 AraC family transcriptional regulator [Neptunicella marina]
MQNVQDNLSEILNRISFSTEVFYSGNLCGVQTLGGNGAGHLHLLESGTLTILTDDGHKVIMNKPSVIFIPGDAVHRIISSESQNAKLVCSTVKFDAANKDSLVNSLPQFVYFNIESRGQAGSTVQWLFEEAFNERLGRQAMLDKLSDIFLLQLLRHVMEQGVILQGVLSAMVHPQLSKVLNAIHDKPQYAWTLEEMADVAAMSRSKFAAVFKSTVGQTPNDYVTGLRLAMAQKLLRNDKPVNIVATEVGYEHGSALARIFRKKLGLSPKEWLQTIRPVKRAS